MKFSAPFLAKIFFVFLVFSLTHTAFGHSSASVSLRWDANDPAPEGYRVFVRQAGNSYDYSHPLWENSLTTCTLTGLTEGVTYQFVVRAYEGDLESVDSEEVSYTPPVTNIDFDEGTGTDPENETTADSDGDNVVDSQDRFPNDPDEWADNDNDGIGNNLDTDDDNDGMTDEWEIAHGLAPFIDDAEQDADGDGVTNLDEFLAGSDATVSSDNNSPEAPVVEDASVVERVGLTPVLVCGEYFDADNDAHYQTRWQISTASDFSTLVLNSTSSTQLYAYTVGEMALDADTVYYWRVQFIDANNNASDWSETATFTTLTAEQMGDADLNGIMDDQKADETADVNENGIADVLENNIMTINTIEGQTTVGVESLSDRVTVVSIKSLSSETIADKSVRLGFGLVGFKLYLQEDVSNASIKIYFSKRVPSNAKLYKYTIENGWKEYEHATFAANRKSVTMVLEDGGMGDEDGVKNGVIVDPSGIAFVDDTVASSDSASVSTGDASASSGGGGGCFISTGNAGASRLDDGAAVVAVILTLLLLVIGVRSAKSAWVKK